MGRTIRLVTTVLLAALLASPLGLVSVVPSQAAPDSSEPEVFSPAPDAPPPPEARLAKRSREVRADLSLFDQRHVRRRLKLTLFDDVKLRAVLDHTEEMSPGVVSWVGHVDGIDLSTVSFVVSNRRVMAGSVIMPGVTYDVTWAADGVHAVSELDPSKLPPDLHAHPDPQRLASDDTSSTATREPTALAVGSPQIDVMVVYSDDARAAAGGTDQIKSKVEAAVLNTNTAYANSGISQRLNLVHTQEMAYDDNADCNTHLNRVTDTNDGYLDDVHALRNSYGADLVALATQTGNCGGIAWVMQNVSTNFAQYGFSMVRADRMVDLIMAHEFGHNMGADHDKDAPGGFVGAYSYSRGFVDPTSPETWTTVMAYTSSCDSFCTRVAYFSNPNKIYEGSPMGIPAGQANAADNTQTLNNTASTVAAFRAATATSPPGAASPISPSGTISTANPTFTWSRVADAAQYRLSVDGTSGSSYSAVTGACGTSTCSATPTLNLANGSYTWNVTTSNAAGETPSATMAFSVSAPPPPPAPPTAVTLIGPSGRDKDNPITYSWNASNAFWYQLLVTNRNGAVVQLWVTAGGACSGSVCSATLDNVMLPAGSYTWYIQASNDKATGPWSSSLSFKIRQPPKAVLIAPVGSVTSPVGFSWNQVSAALWYRLLVKRGSNVVFDQWFLTNELCSAGTCAAPALSLAPANYNWKIETSLDASSGTWSDKTSFTVS